MKNFTLSVVIILIAMVAGGQQNEKLPTSLKSAVSKYTSPNQIAIFRNSSVLLKMNSFRPEMVLKNAAFTQKLDSTVSQYLDFDGLTWIIEWKDEFLYNMEMQNDRWIEKEWIPDSANWEITSEVELEYNDIGKVSSMLILYKDEESMDSIAANRIDAFYNPDGMVDSVKQYYKETESDEDWILATTQNYEYNNSGQLIQFEVESMVPEGDTISEEFSGSLRVNYIYNNDNLLDSVKTYYLFEDQSILYSENVFSYDESGNLATSTTFELDILTFMMEESSMVENQYNTNGDIAAETYSTWDSQAQDWVEELRDEYTYTDMSFSDVAYPSYFYLFGTSENTGGNQNRAIDKIESFEKSGENWDIYGRTFFYYSEAVSTGIDEVDKSIISVYPNPASDQITVSWSGINDRLLLEIYQVTGVKVMEKMTMPGIKVPVGHLNKGLYVYLLKNGRKTVHSGKLIKK